jgi:hypothetical protein
LRFLWLQKDSALAEWDRQRTQTAPATRNTLIVALACKLLIALWRLVGLLRPRASSVGSNQFLRRSPRMVATSSTDVNAQLVAERRQPSLAGTDDARRDAGGMPVHAHHGAKGLKPERIGQPPQQLVASVVVDNGLHEGV